MLAGIISRSCELVRYWVFFLLGTVKAHDDVTLKYVDRWRVLGTSVPALRLQLASSKAHDDASHFSPGVTLLYRILFSRFRAFISMSANNLWLVGLESRAKRSGGEGVTPPTTGFKMTSASLRRFRTTHSSKSCWSDNVLESFRQTCCVLFDWRVFRRPWLAVVFRAFLENVARHGLGKCVSFPLVIDVG